MSKYTKHMEICKKMNDTYRKKNTDYGDSFGKGFKEYGMIMPVIRLEDKFNRVKQLVLSDNKAQVVDERIEDTLLDLANYAIMTLIEIGENTTVSCKPETAKREVPKPEFEPTKIDMSDYAFEGNCEGRNE